MEVDIPQLLSDMCYRYWVIGTLVFPAILFHWYRWLDARYVGLATQTIVKKLLLDQFVISPPILAIFYILMSAMEGKDDLFQEMRYNYKRSKY